MAWQGSGGPGGPGGQPGDGQPDDDTRVDWSPGSTASPPPPPPPAGAPPSGAPSPSPQEPGGYLYPAEIAEQQAAANAPAWPSEPGPSQGVPPAAPPPGEPAPGYPPAPSAQPPAYPAQGGYPPPGTYAPPGVYGAPAASWQAPVVPVPVAGALKFAGTLPRFLAFVLDGLLIGLIVFVILFVVSALVGGGYDATAVNAVMTTGVSALYFIGFWTGKDRSTPGMRLFHLQIGQAADGRTLTVGQASARWLGYGAFLSLFAIIPSLSLLSGVLLIWELVLLVTTMSSPTRQGLHDRIGGSAIVAPVGNEGPVMPCLVLFILGIIVPLAMVFLGVLFLGAAISQVLVDIGTSV